MGRGLRARVRARVRVLEAEWVLVPRVDQPLKPPLQQRQHHGRALQAIK